MKLASIQLKHYHFTRLLLEANDDSGISDAAIHASPYREPDTSKLKTSIVLGEPESFDQDAEPFFVLTLGLEYQEQDFPYNFSASVDGIFTLSEPLSTEEERHRFVVNAASILYSSIRDQLLTISARHKYGPMMLPSVDFRAITPKKKS